MAPAEFVTARNALAKALKADGHRDEAAAVAALRRPTVPDWALNSVALQEPDVVADAVDAAEHLRSVQAAALGDPSAAPDLREAMAQARQAAGSPAQGGRGRAAAGRPAGRGHERPHVEAERDDGAPGPALPAPGRPAGDRGRRRARSVQRRAGGPVDVGRSGAAPAEPRPDRAAHPPRPPGRPPPRSRPRRRSSASTSGPSGRRGGRPSCWSDGGPRPPNDSRRPTPSSTRPRRPCTTPRPR